MHRGRQPLVPEEVMSSEIRCSIEFREDESRRTPGRIVGILIEYETRATDRNEKFRDGALSWDPAGVVLNRQHDRRQPIMRFTPVVEGRALKIDEPLPDTNLGRDLATEIRNKLFTGMSIEFQATKETREGGTRIVEKARLTAAAVVDSSSYQTNVQVRERGARAGRLPRWL